VVVKPVVAVKHERNRFDDYPHRVYREHNEHCLQAYLERQPHRRLLVLLVFVLVEKRVQQYCKNERQDQVAQADERDIHTLDAMNDQFVMEGVAHYGFGFGLLCFDDRV